MNGFIGIFYMQGVYIRIRIDRYGLNAHFPASTYNPDGNFTSIGD